MHLSARMSCRDHLCFCRHHLRHDMLLCSRCSGCSGRPPSAVSVVSRSREVTRLPASMQGLVAGGAWVHVFPEGHVGYSGRLEPCRWGVGRLVCDAAVTAGRCAPQMLATVVS